MSKETAVEWLVDELEKHHVLHDIKNTNAYQIAKAMERDQIEQAYIQGCLDEIDERMESCVEESCKRYYINTYKGGEK